MRNIVFALLIIGGLVMMAATGIAKNSGVGIYAIVDRVTFEPNTTSPERIRISGVFVVPIPMSSGEYAPPQRGFLYFRTAAGHERAARKDWAALTAEAGTGAVVGFTFYWVPNPDDPWGNPHHSLEVTVHAEGAAASPEDYPASVDEVLSVPDGIVKAGHPAFDAVVAKQLHALVPRSDIARQSQSAAVQASIPCKVTQPNGRGPIPHESNHFYGNGSLAVDLWPDGTIVFKPDGGGFIKRDGALGMKFAWWRGVRGELTIDGRRLDKSIAPRPRAESQPAAYPEMGWLPTYLIFPTPGCWEVTGRIGTASLTFVTRVVKIGDGPSWRPDEPDAQSPPADPSAPAAQSKPNFTGTWQALEPSAQDAQAHLMIAQDRSAFVVTDTGADGSPEKLTYRLDGSDSANNTTTATGGLWVQISQAKWVNAAIVIATTINDDHGRAWEGMQVYSLNPDGHLSVTTFDGILTDATMMATTTRLYEKLPSGR